MTVLAFQGEEKLQWCAYLTRGGGGGEGGNKCPHLP